MLTLDLITKIVDGFQGGVLVLDSEGKIYFANHWFLKATDLSAKTICNKTLEELFPEIENTYFLHASQEVIKNQLPAILSNSFHPSPLPLHLSGDQRLQQRIRMVPLSSDKDNYCVIYIQDVTTAISRENILRKQQQALQESMDEAKKANQIKSEFLANMSHEIRTPLNGVIGSASLLDLTIMDEDQRELVNILSSCGENLQEIIHNILDFSKIEAGKIQLEKKQFNLRSCIENAFDFFSGVEKRKSLNIYYHLNDVPEQISGDKTRLQQVIVNLLSNAIKFTEKGDVFLDVQLQSRKQNQLCIVFSVTDNGIGISADKLQQLFKPFIQADTSTTRKYGGTGLGLAICKSLVEGMGGNISVISSVGKGSTFSFTIVVDEAEETDTDKQSQKVIAQILDKKNFLVIENNKAYRILISKQLEDWKIKVLQASDIKEAKEILKETSVDMIIASLDLLNSQDVAFARWLKAEGDYKNVPLIVLQSGIVDVSYKTNLHVDNYLVKPVKKLLLAKTITRLLTNDNNKDQPNTFKAQPLLAHSFSANILLVEDNLVNQKIMMKMLNQLGYSIDIVSDGFEAVKATVELEYDIIFMDLQMPIMGGIEATMKIREQLIEDKQPYIIAFTANVIDGDKDTCIDVGMDDYLPKPVTITVLREILKKAVEKINLHSPL